MASSGKKGKKSKGKTVPLTDFLQETSGITSLPVKKYNWSDEVEDDLQSGYESRPKATNVVLPTAPRAARGPDISDDKIPNHPPFIAYISNLPYDVDEDDISDFFANMKITSMRLPRDDRGGEGGKLKGFGYVEFEDRTSLIDAISIIDTNLKGRRIKIDVATNSDNDRRRGGRMDMGRDRPERPEVAMGDWRSGPRSDPQPESRGGGGSSGFNRDRDRDRDRDGAESNRPGAWRDSSDRPSYRDTDRDRGYSRDSDRNYSNRGRFEDRDGDRRGGGGSSGGGGGGFSSRRYGDRDGYERDNDFRRGNKDDGPDREAPRSRPKLKLAPRTKPLEETDKPIKVQEEQAPSVPAASIFGAAKPVDTSARERQIEERLAREKETRLPPRDSSRDNKSKESKEDEEEKPPKKEWGRKRDDYDEAPRKDSPERRPSSRGPPPPAPARRNDDRKQTGNRDKAPTKKDERPLKRDERPQRENHERELPKLKEPKPPNFAASNIYETLVPEDECD